MVFYFPLNGNDLLALLIFILHTSVATILIFYLVHFIVAVSALPTYKFIDVVNFLVHYLNALVAYWTILLETYKYRNLQKQFWTILNEMTEVYCRQINRKCFWILFFHLLMLSTISIISFTQEHDTPYDVKVLYFILLNYCDIRLFYLMIYFDVIEFNLKRIENELNLNANNSIRKFYNFGWIRKYYGFIYKISECINTMFGWSELATTLFSFGTLLTYINVAYRLFDDDFFLLLSSFSFGLLIHFWVLAAFSTRPTSVSSW